MAAETTRVMNGRSSSASSPPSMHGGAPSRQAHLKPRSSGGIRITTVKRKAPPPGGVGPGAAAGPSRLSSSQPAKQTSMGSIAPRNALPAERLRRIEEEAAERAREKERKDRAEYESRVRQAKSSAPPRSKEAHKGPIRKGTKRPKVDDRRSSLTASPAPSSGSRRASAAPVVSTAYAKLGRQGVEADYRVPRQAAFIEDRGEAWNGAISSAALVQIAVANGRRYGSYFRDLVPETKHVTLQYPSGDTEAFPLEVPAVVDEYDPLSDLLRSIRCIVAHYLPKEWAAEHVGKLDSLNFSSAAGAILQPQHVSPLKGGAGALGDSTPLLGTSSPAHSTSATNSPGTKSSAPAPIPSDNGSTTPLTTDGYATPKAPGTPSTSAQIGSSSHASGDSILRSLTKARNRRDGPLFVSTLAKFNEAVSKARQEGLIAERIEKEWSEEGLPTPVWETISEQSYARTVGPKVEQLAKYEAFSDNVYGELLPRFMSEVAQLTRLGSSSVFVDLGSGVSNLVLQVSLQTGASSYGVEMMSNACELGSEQVKEAKKRCKMWAVSMGDVQSWKGDFTSDDTTRQWLTKADVVLVNNYAFTARTNDSLSLLFLDLKDGAKVVSLKPFVPPDFRLTERTLDSPLAILSVEQRSYGSGYVSWADGGGNYYIHTVDRSMVKGFLDKTSTSTRAAPSNPRRWKRAKMEDSEESDE
ncbi:DOT1-domain-containing protein [Ceraceosorus guamensis]|uniref:Histone-lysine N-methyltransferase, H3 lysine-79 specific n=1 Tax=Ceraceosorus guamensis TaxID=1522189 RepID=A0A316VRW5_9BASI|nr:DOT1-domain-containing protein [Ceraceosorus guamensis]PWN40346.1 DOT1-domain-containing protein [Ceraceosorus guamensis]